MKNIYFFFLLISFIFYKSQAPSIQWNKYIGGSQQEVVNAMKVTSDGGYIFAGSTQSIYINNIFMNHHGSTIRPDYWILKTDSNGIIQWTKSFGGTAEDKAYDVQQTSDGGYIVVGTTQSNDGDITDHIGNGGWADCWVLKLDSLGNLQWKKSFGGTSHDYANTIILTSDGNYVIAGSSYSINGDLPGHHGSQLATDAWMIKISPLGGVIWSKSLGGGSDDMFKDLQQTPDGGFILAADSWSNDGDVVNSHHGTTDFSDMWIVKTDSNGNIQWQKSLGGTNHEISNSVELIPDGGFIFAGEGKSADGDVSYHFGQTAAFPAPDYWIVKTDGSGTIQWEKSYGGTNSDMAISAKSAVGGGYLVAGHTGSTDGQIIERFGANFNYDYWILKLNGSGDIIWQKTLGGQNDDYITDIYPINTGYVAAGRSNSNSQSVFDLLLFELGPESLGVENFTVKSSVSLYPNPVIDILYFSEQLVQIELYAMDGKLIRKIPFAKSVDLSVLLKGEYLLKGITSKLQIVSKKFFKN